MPGALYPKTQTLQLGGHPEQDGTHAETWSHGTDDAQQAQQHQHRLFGGDAIFMSQLKGPDVGL